MFTKEKLYGSGTLVLICLHIYHLNYIGIQMLQLFNSFNSSLSGCPFYYLCFQALVTWFSMLFNRKAWSKLSNNCFKLHIFTNFFYEK